MPLASLCTVFADGDWIESKDQAPDGVRLVQTGNVGEGEFKDRAEKARYVTQDTFKRLRCTEIFPGDCLISRLPDPVGRACLIPEVGERMITAVDCTILRFDASKLLPEFFAFYSQSSAYLSAVEAEATGTTRKRISRARLGQVAVPVAPMAEQRRIVAILDDAFEGIAIAKANAEKNLQNARALFDGQLKRVFTECGPDWSRETIDQHVRFIDYRGRTPEKTARGLRLITAKNVKKGFIQEEPMEFVAPESYDSWMTRGIPQVGDVLFTTEAPLGNVAQLDTKDRVVFAQRVIIMQADSSVLDSAFLKYMLLSAPVQAMVHAKATGATAQGIKASLLKRIEISFPRSVRDQKAIVATLDSLEEESDRLEGISIRKLAALDELKKSLLHLAFTGRLTAKASDRQLEAIA